MTEDNSSRLTVVKVGFPGLQQSEILTVTASHKKICHCIRAQRNADTRQPSIQSKMIVPEQTKSTEIRVHDENYLVFMESGILPIPHQNASSSAGKTVKVAGMPCELK